MISSTRSKPKKREAPGRPDLRPQDRQKIPPPQGRKLPPQPLPGPLNRSRSRKHSNNSRQDSRGHLNSRSPNSSSVQTRWTAPACSSPLCPTTARRCVRNRSGWKRNARSAKDWRLSAANSSGWSSSERKPNCANSSARNRSAPACSRRS